MPNALRRRLLQAVGASILVLVAPVALAQWITVGKVVVEVLGGVYAALGISQYMQKWLQDKRCNVSIDDLENIKFQCQTVALSLDSQGGGAVPLLKAYIEKGDEESWHRAKIALGTFLNNSAELMSAVNAVVNKIGPETYPGSRDDILRLYDGLARIRAAVSLLASLPDKPEAETIGMAKSVLSSISNLPDMAQNAVGQLQAAVDDRRKVSCPS